MPKVSVVIPVHNVADHLDACVRSVMNQTLQEIEIICVDDASTDDSPKILRDLAAQDKRIRVITLPQNLTANQARKDGVLASKGETVMFLDGDDMLLPTACETAYEGLKFHNVDILHYGTRIINRSGVPEGRIKSNEKHVAPHLGRIEGDLILSCFKEKKFSFTLWNKIFKGSVARKAFLEIEDGRFPRAQDLYAVFVLLYFSRSYQGIADILIHYQFGTGITGNTIYNLSRFEKICEASKVANAIASFIEKRKAQDKYGDICGTIRKNLLSDTITQWANHLPPEDASAGLDLIAQNWEPQELVAALAEKSAVNPTTFSAARMARFAANATKVRLGHERRAKTIAVFYYRLHSGGVQRVISLLIPMFLSWGFRVIMITQEQDKNEYPLPQGVTRVLIPPFDKKNWSNLLSRFQSLASIIREHNVDILNYHATTGDNVFFDTLLAKLLGCRIVLSRHELAFAPFLSASDLIVQQSSLFSLADAMTVLTRMDEQYYKILGLPAIYVPNPRPQSPLERAQANLAAPIILWAGRMDYWYKQCQEPIEIMAEVVRSVPDAKLIMIGGGWSPGAEQKMRDRIVALKLQNNIELRGYTPNPEEYYRKAACVLVTSSCESYGMVIAESKAFGLPLVVYRLPYLELLQSGKGYVAVDQSDRRAAAEAIVRLLKNPEYRKRLATEARQDFMSMSDGFLTQQWKRVLSLKPINRISREEIDIPRLKMLFESMLDLYGRGIARKNSELSEVRKKLAEIQSASANGPTVEPVPQSSSRPQLAHPIAPGADRLEILEERRRRLGPIGAIDFLIDIERRKSAVKR